MYIYGDGENWNSANMTPDHTYYLENDDDAENLKNDRGPLSM